MNIEIRLFRSQKQKRLIDIGQEFKAEIERTIDEEVKPYFLAMFDAVVENWQHKPKFNAKKIITRDSVALHIEPFGPDAKYWVWTSEGTKPHLIRAVNAPTLLFRGQYAAKTQPGPPPTWGGSGKSSGAWVSKSMVHHPGTTPRHFEEYISNEGREWWKRTMKNAVERGLRR